MRYCLLLLIPLFAGCAHGLADPKGHEGDFGQMVINDIVEAAG